jgi:hypothetical protein
MVTTQQSSQLGCTDACGRTTPTFKDAMQAGWTVLQITGRLRCPECRRALETVNQRKKEGEEI